jgi:hypothetical protein
MELLLLLPLLDVVIGLALERAIKTGLKKWRWSGFVTLWPILLFSDRVSDFLYK